jgi:DNA-binding transcriptional LysR family regulator
LRLIRPQAGRAICRRIGTIGYAVYAAKDKPASDLPWITYEEGYAHLPQARWVARHHTGIKHMPMAVSDGDSILQAVQSGIGRGVLPTFIADEIPGLVRLSAGPPILQRDVWLVVHPDLRKTARVSAVLDWLDEVMQTVS